MPKIVIPYGRDKIVIQKTDYKGKVAVDMRVWYHDEKGELQATKQGFRIPPERIGEVISALELNR